MLKRLVILTLFLAPFTAGANPVACEVAAAQKLKLQPAVEYLGPGILEDYARLGTEIKAMIAGSKTFSDQDIGFIRNALGINDRYSRQDVERMYFGQAAFLRQAIRNKITIELAKSLRGHAFVTSPHTKEKITQLLPDLNSNWWDAGFTNFQSEPNFSNPGVIRAILGRILFQHPNLTNISDDDVAVLLAAHHANAIIAKTEFNFGKPPWSESAQVKQEQVEMRLPSLRQALTDLLAMLDTAKFGSPDFILRAINTNNLFEDESFGGFQAGKALKTSCCGGGCSDCPMAGRNRPNMAESVYAFAQVPMNLTVLTVAGDMRDSFPNSGIAALANGRSN